jgi:hypothetical protein
MSFAHVTKKSSLKSLYLPCNCHVISSGQSPLTTTLPHCNPHPLLSATLTISSLQPSPFPPCNPHRFLPATLTVSSLQLSPHPLCNFHSILCNSHFTPSATLTLYLYTIYIFPTLLLPLSYIPLRCIYLSNTSFASLLQEDLIGQLQLIRGHCHVKLENPGGIEPVDKVKRVTVQSRRKFTGPDEKEDEEE